MVPALYTTCALLTLAWLALTLWALFADRSRGRARCPKCFFSLEGLDTPRCPECGRDVTDKGQLHRIRHRWGVAALSAVLLLPPAALTGGLARVKQAGAWADVPTAVLVRLLWLRDEAVHTEVLDRIKEHEVSRAQGAVIARRAAADLASDDQREGAYQLFERLSRNSYSSALNERSPMLEELATDRTVPALLSRLEQGDPLEQARVLNLLGHLRDADERANLVVLASLGHEDLRVSRAAADALTSQWRQSPSVTRLPPPPRLLREHGWQAAAESLNAQVEKQSLGRAIDACAQDRSALLDLARGLATGEPTGPSGEPVGVLQRTAGLWLLSRLAPHDPLTFSLLEQAMGASEPDVRLTAVEQLRAFTWSNRVEAMLRLALNDPGPQSQVQFQATQVIKHFGTQARGLIPDMLAYARSPYRGVGSAFPEEFQAAGGRPEDLLAVLVDRLTEAKQQIEASIPEPERILIYFDFRWIADLGLQDARAAEIVRWFVEHPVIDTPMTYSESSYAILAYAVLTGDVDYATRSALARNPDLTSGFSVGSVEEALLELSRRGLAQPELLAEYFVQNGGPEQRAGFIALLKWVPSELLGGYRRSIEQLTADPDPAIAAAAATQLQRLD